MRDIVQRLMQEQQGCWHCGHPAEESLFCKFCNHLLRPTPDYFKFFDLPKRLSVDTGDLQQRFYRLSRLLHPDRYTRGPSTERQFSLEATAILNDAYRTLRDPVARAEYVLKENGFEMAEQRSKDVPPELLEEVFELNMALEELRGGDEDARGPLEESRKKFLDMRDDVDARLQALFKRHDAAKDGQEAEEILLDIRSLLARRRYIRNLVDQVQKELAAAQ